MRQTISTLPRSFAGSNFCSEILGARRRALRVRRQPPARQHRDPLCRLRRAPDVCRRRMDARRLSSQLHLRSNGALPVLRPTSEPTLLPSFAWIGRAAGCLSRVSTSPSATPRASSSSISHGPDDSAARVLLRTERARHEEADPGVSCEPTRGQCLIHTTTTKLDRRTLSSTAGVVASSAIASSALSYGRILGANDRIGLGHIGVGNRGSGLHMMTSRLKDQYKVETVAVCDLWTRNRDRAVANSERYYGHAPRAFQHLEELLALKEVDAVLIATPEHSHSPVLKSRRGGRKGRVLREADGQCARRKSKPRAMRSSESRRVVQIGTQHRSEPYQLAAREVLRSGALGEVSKYEIVWNYNGPRWRGRPEVKLVREADVDWKKWLMTKPYRPFDPQLYFEFRLYREFSSGIPDQWMSHGIDLVHFFMNDQPPRSVVAHGGVFAWHDGRENPDTFHALVEYPSMLASYATSFGNDSDSFSRIMGKKATLVNIGGEGSPRWKLVEEKGNHEDNPTIARAERWVTLPGDDKPGPINIGDEDLSHLTNWFECLRSRNTKTNATVDNGFLHSVAIIMAAQSYWQGKRLYYDAASEQIKDSAPASSSAGAHG